MENNAVDRICSYNEGRIPAMRAIKYRNMRADEFAFFRGTSHLFYEDWPAGNTLDDAPFSWVCGDLHLENFGTYKGADRLVYFDVNDFDDAALAQCTWDVTRLATSLMVASNAHKLPIDTADHLCLILLKAYFSTLAKGIIQTMDRSNAEGLIKKLMHTLKDRKRIDFLDQNSRKVYTIRKFKLKENRLLQVSETEYKYVTDIVTRLGRIKKYPEFYKIHDIAFRVAGTGSLGINRYAVLVEGRGFPEDNFILDIKEVRHSALEPYLAKPQSNWTSEAERATTIQKFFQAAPAALLTTVKNGEHSFLVRELQPVQDRINFRDWSDNISQIEHSCVMLANIVGWGQLRCAGLQGSSPIDELIQFGKKTEVITEILSYSQRYSQQVHHDFKMFAKAYDDGKL